MQVMRWSGAAPSYERMCATCDGVGASYLRIGVRAAPRAGALAGAVAHAASSRCVLAGRRANRGGREAAGGRRLIGATGP